MNKNFIKISYILGFIFGIIECMSAILIVPGIISIVGASKIKKIYEKKPNDILNNMDAIFAWGVVLSLLCFPSGVILLIFYIIEQRKVLK